MDIFKIAVEIQKKFWLELNQMMLHAGQHIHILVETAVLTEKGNVEWFMG